MTLIEICKFCDFLALFEVAFLRAVFLLGLSTSQHSNLHFDSSELCPWRQITVIHWTPSLSILNYVSFSFAGQYHHIGIATISIVLTLVLSICAWFIYAYFFPHTWSGQLLIKVRFLHDKDTHFLRPAFDHLWKNHISYNSSAVWFLNNKSDN